LFHSLGLLTSLPVLYVCNVEEASAATGNDYSRLVEKRAAEEGAACVVISAKIESEIAVLPRDEREMFLSEIGLKEPGPRPADPGRLRPSPSCDVLHRWPEGNARLDHHGRNAAHRRVRGVIHTDFERGFIRAETIAYDDYVKAGGEAGARDIGKLRLEGKTIHRRRRRRDAFPVCDVSEAQAADRKTIWVELARSLRRSPRTPASPV